MFSKCLQTDLKWRSESRPALFLRWCSPYQDLVIPGTDSVRSAPKGLPNSGPWLKFCPSPGDQILPFCLVCAQKYSPQGSVASCIYAKFHSWGMLGWQTPKLACCEDPWQLWLGSLWAQWQNPEDVRFGHRLLICCLRHLTQPDSYRGQTYLFNLEEKHDLKQNKYISSYGFTINFIPLPISRIIHLCYSSNREVNFTQGDLNPGLPSP